MKKMQEVRPEDFDVEMLLAAAREGRLFLEEKSESAEETLARCRQEALAYVKPIEAFASDEWAPYINKVWEAIAYDDLFSPMLLMQKGRMRGQLNRYFITNIVFLLNALNIYQCDNLIMLHRTLERVETKNSIYKSASSYCLCKAQRLKIREILQKIESLK